MIELSQTGKPNHFELFGIICDLINVLFCISRSEPGNLTPVRDSPAIPRLRSVNSYTNIRTATTARNLNKSLQNLNLNEEGKTERREQSAGKLMRVK